MKKLHQIQSRARQTKLVAQRIAENKAAQEIDLTKWIFERLKILPEDSILELGCGTGAQTLKMAETLNDKGRIIAIDIAKEALDTIASKLEKSQTALVTLLESNMDKFGDALKDHRFNDLQYDLCFCAYALYYSSDPEKVLNGLKSRLTETGRIVIVGPYGSNNKPFFDLLKSCGVVLPDLVTYSSQDFMCDLVLTWAIRNFKAIQISTVTNRIRWNKSDNVLNYWRGTTFYESEKFPVVEEAINLHFKKYPEFINEKWIMLTEMTDAHA